MFDKVILYCHALEIFECLWWAIYVQDESLF